MGLWLEHPFLPGDTSTPGFWGFGGYKETLDGHLAILRVHAETIPRVGGAPKNRTRKCAVAHWSRICSILLKFGLSEPIC